MLTNAAVLDRYNLTAELEAEMLDALIPTVTTLARQGDVLVTRRQVKAATTPIPAAGVVVVRSEARSGNTHLLHSLTGTCYFTPEQQPDKGGQVVYGTLTVPTGCTAVLIHTAEHGAVAFAEGMYQIRGQVEGASELRRVTD